MTETLEAVRIKLQGLAKSYPDRLRRSKRIFIEERAAALASHREIEFAIKEQVAQFFGIKYAEVAFTGSAQIGFSPTKNRLFMPAKSDLDIACVSAHLFQAGWNDVIATTRAFTDNTKFSGGQHDIDLFKDSILRRGMMRIEVMPLSPLVAQWKDFESSLSRQYSGFFGSVGCAIYLNEYAFCWKQDSAISMIMRA